MARAAAGAAAYLVHRIGRRSDATDEETDADLAEDELGTQPMWESTRQSESDDADRRGDSEPARDSMNVATTPARHGLWLQLSPAAVDLYWLPLGAGAPSGSRLVRFNGKAYEALSAAFERRQPLDLYHAGLEVSLGDGFFVIEVAPSPDAWHARRGVVAEGPVGSRLAGVLRLFRYEVRCWSGGAIPDVDEAVASPVRVTDDPETAHRLLELVPTVPSLVWGRDELQTGDMWNSNSVISWLIARAGLPVEDVALPPHGRAPGWAAGIRAARSNPLWRRLG